MTKWDALREIMEYIAIYWDEKRNPLTPVWMWTLMGIAEEAQEEGWDLELLRQKLEDRKS